MTFSYKFEHSADTVYFAYSLPYTYTDLVNDLNAIEMDPARQGIISRRLLCHTLAGNRCEYLTITEPVSQLDRAKKRKGVVITARVHPGESVGSWMMKGVIEFITS